MVDTKHAPDSLKYQWRVLALIMRSDWATGLDKSIAFEIIDNYRKDHRNSRASLSYLQTATGADRKAVIASTRRLVEHGPLSVTRQGAGTRPTEYKVHFDLVAENASSGVEATTRDIDPSSGLETTPSSGLDTTASGFSSGLPTTESVLPVAAYKAGVLDRMNECTAPTAPPAVGLEATAAETAQEGFEELWRAYGYRQKKREARAAYEKLSPDVELHSSMVESATAWKDRWAEQGKKDAPRFTLAKWIEREEFECDPPTAYKPKERKAPPAAREQMTADNDNLPDDDFDDVPAGPEMVLDVGPFTPFGTFNATIIDSTVKTPDEFTEEIVLDLEMDLPNSAYKAGAQHTLYFRHPDPSVQFRGRRFLHLLERCLDIDALQDTEQLHGRQVICTIGERLDIRYQRAA